MLRSMIAAVMLAMSVVPSLAVGPNLDAKPIVAGSISLFVRPAYAKFHAATSTLDKAMTDLCSSPSQATLESAKKAFGETVETWSKAEIIRFGPVTEENRLERVLFWPDRKSTGLKQVQAALAAKDPTAIEPAKLAGKSVAMQGLGALEFVLFGTGAEALSGTTEAYRCGYGAAIAGNLEAIATDLETAWSAPDGFAALWTAPGAGNPLYRDDSEALGELLDVFVNGLELVRDVRLGGFLGKSATEDRPKQALFWRSGNTANSLAANMAGMNSLFEASGLAGAMPADADWIAKSIRFEFDNALDAAAAAQGPIADVLADPARRGKLDYFGVVTSSLSELFGVRLSGELGLTAGFSSLDGD